MCLYTKKGPKTSSKRIPCYKVFMVCEYTNKNYGKKTFCYTPFTWCNIKEAIKNGKFEAYGDEVIKEVKDSKIPIIKIGSGFIHSYKNIEGARSAASSIAQHMMLSPSYYDFRLYTPTNIVIYKCYIPKDTRYFYGEPELNNGSVGCYASKSIEFSNPTCLFLKLINRRYPDISNVNNNRIIGCEWFTNKDEEYISLINKIKN